MTATVDAAAPVRATRPFSPFEWMVAFRYLRARNAQKSISVIAGFSFLGIVLGVAALIVVMSVMNGFRHDLLEKMIGLNGHMFLQGIETPLTDYEAVDRAGEQGPGRDPGPAAGRGPGLRHLASSAQSGALVRGIRQQDLERLPGVAGHLTPGHARRIRRRAGGGDRREARRPSEPQGRRQGHHHRAARGRDAVRRHPADEGLYGRRDLPDRHGDLRQHLHLHAARRGADLLQLRGPGERDRGLCRQSRRHGRHAPGDRAGAAASDDRHRLAPAQPQLLRRARRSRAT